jgi:hypothetical protein
MNRFYLFSAVAGTVLPFTFLVRFVLANGLNASEFARRLFQNDIAMFFAMDVVIAAVVLWAFVFAEGRKMAMRHLWVYVLGTVLVGVSLALPLFLSSASAKAKEPLRLVGPKRCNAR